MKNHLIALFILLLSSSLSGQNDWISGPTTLHIECCATYELQSQDSISSTNTGFWVVFDWQKNPIDTIYTQGRTQQITICGDQYPNAGSPIILQFENPNGTEPITKVIEIIYDRPNIFYDHECVIDQRSGIIQVCEGTVGWYGVEVDTAWVDWTVTNGTILENQFSSIEVLWDKPGIGRITVVMFSGNCTFQEEFEIHVLPAPKANFITSPGLSANRELNVCRGQNIKFKSTSLNAPNLYWSFGDGKASKEVEPSHSYDLAGKYEVQLITPLGCHCTDTINAIINVSDDVAPQLDCIGTICPGEEATYHVLTNCQEVNWTVSSNGIIIDGGTSKDDFITVNWTAGPKGEITIEGINCPIGDCSAPNTFEIPIISQNGPLIGDQIVCIGDVSTYEVPKFQGTSYYWTVGNGGTIIGNNSSNSIAVFWSYGAVGSKKQIKVEYDNCYLGCGGSDSLDVTIKDKFEVIGQQAGCEGQSINFQARNVASQNPINVDWVILDQNNISIHSSGSSDDEYNIPATLVPGIYTIMATYSGQDICNEEFKSKFTIQKAPDMPDGINGDALICKGQMHHFELINFKNNLITEWEINDGANVTVVANKSSLGHVFQSDGPYLIRARYKSLDPLGCYSNYVDYTPVKLQFTIDGDQQTCLNGSTSYNCSNLDINLYEWEIDPPSAGVITSGKNESTVTIYWTQPGVHNVILNACESSEQVSVDVKAVELPNVIGPAGLCPGSTQKVSANGNYKSILWFDDQNKPVGNSSTLFLGPGQYKILVENDFGCVDSMYHRINAFDVPQAVLSIAESRIFCETEPFSPKTLYANTDGNFNYQWFKDGVSLGSGGPTYDATLYGSYHVVVSNAEGCSDISNIITLLDDCKANRSGECTGGNCRKVTCPDHLAVSFTYSDDPVYCNIKTFQNTTAAKVIDYKWVVEDLENSSWTNHADQILTYTFPTAGYYTVFLDAHIQIPGLPDSCITNEHQVVTIPVASDFKFIDACFGETIQFEDLSTHLPNHSIIDYSWEFGDPASGGSNFSSMPSPSHLFSSSGIFNVSLITTSSTGCISQITKQVIIDPPTYYTIDITTPVCPFVPVQFKINEPFLNAKWNFGDPTTSSDTASSGLTYYQYGQSGQFTSKLIITDLNGCTQEFQNLVDISNPPAAKPVNIVGNTTLCEGEKVELQATDGYKWLWNTGERTSSIFVSTAGEYYVTTYFPDGCENESPKVNIDVNPLPKVFSIGEKVNAQGEFVYSSATQIELCEGEYLNLKSISDKASYQFKWSDGAFGKNRNNIWLKAGNYTYTVEATDLATGCSAISNQLNVIVHPNPDIPNISADRSPPYCAGDILTIKVNNVQPGIQYVWSNGETGSQIKTSNAGVYFVKAIGPGGCDIQSRSITIEALPDVDFILTGCYQRCASDTFCLPSLANVKKYQWYKDGAPVSSPDGQVPDFIFTETGTYQLELTNSNGCSAISGELNFEILPGYGDIIINAYFDTNGNGILDAGDQLLPDLEITTTLPDASSSVDSTDISGEIKWLNTISGDYKLSISDTSYILVIGEDSVHVEGCDNEYVVNLLVTNKCDVYQLKIDTTICLFDTIFIGNEKYIDEGTYQYTGQTTEGCDTIIDLQITHRDADQIKIDTFFCNRDSFTLNGKRYYDEGLYTFQDTNSFGCVEITELNISREWPINTLDSTICEGEFITFGDSVLTEQGFYQFDIIDQFGCLEEFAVTLSVDQSKAILGLTVYLDINENGTIDGSDSLLENIPLIIEDENGFVRYANTNNLGYAELINLISNNYTVRIDTDGLPESYLLKTGPQDIFLEPCGDIGSLSFLIQEIPSVFIPNVFTPDGDDINDHFRIYTRWPDDIILNLSIYDRWGELVFSFEGQGDQKDVIWNGTLNETTMNPAVFVYVAEVMHRSGKSNIYSGDVTLVR